MTKRKKGDMDWLSLESRIRQELREIDLQVNPYIVPAPLRKFVCAVNEIVGSETGRGYELGPDWEDM